MSKNIIIVALLSLVCSTANAERLTLALRSSSFKTKSVDVTKPVFAEIAPAAATTTVDVLVPVATQEITSNKNLNLSSQQLDSSNMYLDLYSSEATPLTPSITSLNLHVAMRTR
ncbi:MAG: hypothetical protein AAF497_06555 [Planctomycetota bacterium]